MPQPRKYDTNAERQAAYRARRNGQDAPTPALAVTVPVLPEAIPTRSTDAGCTAYTPRGTRCKFCGKTH